MVPELRGKKLRHSLEIIAALALNGPCTTREMAKFTNSHSTDYSNTELKGANSVSVTERIFRKLLLGIDRNNKKRNDKPSRYPGLLDQGFVESTEEYLNEKNRPVKKYFLSLKGCFFALGFRFTDTEMSLFLKNASYNHLMFAYLNRIAKDSSVNLVSELFLGPIKDMIRKGLLNCGQLVSVMSVFEPIQMNIAKKISARFEMDSSDESYDKAWDYHDYVQQKIFRHTFYTEKPTTDWLYFIIEYFYPSEKERMEIEIHDRKLVEAVNLYRLMKAAHFGYSRGMAIEASTRTQSIPYSKRWKEFKKRNPKYKSPSHYDKKNHQVVDYSAGYAVS